MINHWIRNLDRTFARILIITLTTMLGAGTAWAFSGGPPDEKTNAPGETNCTDCHNSFDLNSGTGELLVIGPVGTYTPDQAYALEVTLSDPDASRWGFEFTILDANGDSVGELVEADGNTQISSTGALGRTYAKHTGPGTQNGQTVSASWTVNWTAPASGVGDVTLYIAGNAANGNFSNDGDRIYATSFAWSEEPATSVDSPDLIARLLPNYPNPFNPRTTLSFALDRPAHVELSIYDLRGAKIRTLYRGDAPAGHHQANWDGTDTAGRRQPSGTYLARIIGADGHDMYPAQKMTMTK